jgi:hypothetical protein
MENLLQWVKKNTLSHAKSTPTTPYFLPLYSPKQRKIRGKDEIFLPHYQPKERIFQFFFSPTFICMIIYCIFATLN